LWKKGEKRRGKRQSAVSCHRGFLIRVHDLQSVKRGGGGPELREEWQSRGDRLGGRKNGTDWLEYIERRFASDPEWKKKKGGGRSV